MNDYFTIIETLTNGYWVETLDVASIFALSAGVVVIITKNPIGSLMSLIILFGCIATYLIMCGLTFIGFSYLIVYIGAVSILFLFILMLINVRTSELLSPNSNSIPLALFVLLLVNYLFFEVLPYSIAILNNYINQINIYVYFSGKTHEFVRWIAEFKNMIRFVISNSWDGNLNETSHISSIGNILYTSHNMWLFMASLILLLAMVGAIAITVNKSNSREINSMVEWLSYTQFVKGSSPLFLRDSLT